MASGQVEFSSPDLVGVINLKVLKGVVDDIQWGSVYAVSKQIH